MEISYGASFVEFFAEESKRIYGDVISPTIADRRLFVLRQVRNLYLVHFHLFNLIVSNVDALNAASCYCWQCLLCNWPSNIKKTCFYAIKRRCVSFSSLRYSFHEGMFAQEPTQLNISLYLCDTTWLYRKMRWCERIHESSRSGDSVRRLKKNHLRNEKEFQLLYSPRSGM